MEETINRIDGANTQEPEAPAAGSVETMTAEISERSWIAALLLCFFLGGLGAHRFYLGYTGRGILMLVLSIVGGVLTLVIIGLIPLAIVSLMAFIDFIMIIIGKLHDVQGRPLKK